MQWQAGSWLQETWNLKRVKKKTESELTLI